jgi:hypothetical protein
MGLNDALAKPQTGAGRNLGSVSISRCQLYADGIQEPGQTTLAVKYLRPIHFSCEGSKGKRVATRELNVNGQEYYLLVDPDHLTTSIEKKMCYRCQLFLNSDSVDPFHQAVELTSKISPVQQKRKVILNAGLRASSRLTKGSFLTGDLCPSHHPLDRDFIEKIEAESHSKTELGIPISLSITGVWLRRHEADFEWLKDQVETKSLSITWTNHSFHHPFSEKSPLEDTFMLEKGLDIDEEILGLERALVEHGVTPSVFFRFPGLASDLSLQNKMRDLHLVVLGTNAWIAKGQLPRNGSIILVHPNGNEEKGIKGFESLLESTKVPIPLLDISRAPL